MRVYAGGTPLYGLCMVFSNLVPRAFPYLQGKSPGDEVGFSAVMVINRVSILAILVINSVLFLQSSVESGMFFR